MDNYESSDDEDVDEILDEMYEFEEDFEQQEKNNDEYFLGLYVHMKDVQMMVSGMLVEDSEKLYLGIAVSTRLFFKYKYKHVQKYLCSSIMYGPNAQYYNITVNIMKLHIIDDGLYLVTIKTYWIRLIQRHWKSVLRKRKERIDRLKCYSSLKLREITSKYREAYPTLAGMLHMYSSNKKDLYKHCQ